MHSLGKWSAGVSVRNSGEANRASLVYTSWEYFTCIHMDVTQHLFYSFHYSGHFSLQQKYIHTHTGTCISRSESHH